MHVASIPSSTTPSANNESFEVIRLKNCLIKNSGIEDVTTTKSATAVESFDE